MNHPFSPALRDTNAPLLGRRFIPGHTLAKPELGQSLLKDIIDSPWTDVALRGLTGILLIAIGATSFDKLPILKIAAYLGGGGWLFQAIMILAEQLEGEKKTPPEVDQL